MLVDETAEIDITVLVKVGKFNKGKIFFTFQFGCSVLAHLRRIPLNVRAVSAKIKLPKKYLQHCHILRKDKKNVSLLLLPS